MFVVKGETSRSHEIDEKCFHEELCSSDRSGQLDITPSVIRALNSLSENIRVEQTHDRSGRSSDRSGQLDITPSVIRALNSLSENIRVEQTHDRSGQPDKHTNERKDVP